MRSSISPRFTAILVPIALLSLMLSCNLFVTEKKTNLFYHYYHIEPETLLEALEAGNTTVFIPIPDEPTLIPGDQRSTVPWTQVDYMHIANALYEYVRGESLDDWQLNRMDFALGCEEYGEGLQDGNFEFFKIIKSGEADARIAVIVNINPKGKFAFISENQYYPRLMNWSSIDRKQNQLSATTVLQIAENAGGQKMRLSTENGCDISMWLSPDSANYNGWEVNYTRNDGASLFRIQIDPKTGEIHSQ